MVVESFFHLYQILASQLVDLQAVRSLQQTLAMEAQISQAYKLWGCWE